MGRTGTFLAIDMLARYIRSSIAFEGENALMNGKDEGESVYANLTNSGKSIPLQNRTVIMKCASKVDVFQAVLWLRSQRMKSVEQDVRLTLFY